MSFELLAFKNLWHVHFCRFPYTDMIKIYSFSFEMCSTLRQHHAYILVLDKQCFGSYRSFPNVIVVTLVNILTRYVSFLVSTIVKTVRSHNCLTKCLIVLCNTICPLVIWKYSNITYKKNQKKKSLQIFDRTFTCLLDNVRSPIYSQKFQCFNLLVVANIHESIFSGGFI